jgi:hypothetical protein
MAIRATDLQSQLYQSTLNASLAAKTEEGPRAAQAQTQAIFAAQVADRETSVAATSSVEGSKVNADADRDARRDEEEREAAEREPRGLFQQTVDDASGREEPPHRIDFTA